MLSLAREMIAISTVEWSEDAVIELLDTIDPSIRRYMLLDNLKGVGDHITADHTSGIVRQKINAIKEVRAATGYGLKEAKDLIDAADDGRVLKLPEMDWERKSRLQTALRGTGYMLG